MSGHLVEKKMFIAPHGDVSVNPVDYGILVSLTDKYSVRLKTIN